MGIRMLHRWAVRAQATVRARIRFRAAAAPTPVRPAVAPDASTVRIPIAPAEVLSRAATDVRDRLTRRAPAEGVTADEAEPPIWRQWAEVGRNCLALARAWRPRARPVRTMTVFVAAVVTAASPPAPFSAPPGPPPGPEAPGPDATP
ncbi:hypothetical protein [Streptomyces sp. YIM S03343]